MGPSAEPFPIRQTKVKVKAGNDKWVLVVRTFPCDQRIGQLLRKRHQCEWPPRDNESGSNLADQSSDLST